MKLFTKAICGLLTLGTLSFAAVPVASLSGAGPFTLDGNSLALTGILSWPLVVGDEVATAAGSGNILFKDGSNVKLAPKSTLKIAGTEARPIVVIESGSVDYKLLKDSKLSIIRLEDAQMPEFRTVTTGKLPSNSHNSVLAAGTASAVGGAAALGVALANHGVVSSGSSSVVGTLSSSSSTPVAASTGGEAASDPTVRSLTLSKYK